MLAPFKDVRQKYKSTSENCTLHNMIKIHKKFVKMTKFLFQQCYKTAI